MKIEDFYKTKDEKPLDNLVANGGYCGIIRKMSVIGDSLSSGELESLNENDEKGYHDFYDYSWGKFMERDTGNSVNIFAKGGMTVREYLDSFADSKGFWNVEYNSQAYIIALGVNDLGHMDKGDYELGSVKDIDLNNYENNKKTFVGMYGKIIQRYKEIQPKAKFFLVTMPREPFVDTEKGRKWFKYKEDTNEAIRSLAKHFDNTYVIDLYKYAPEYDDEIKSKFYMGGHLSAIGYRLTALMIESYIDYIIRHNIDDFRQIGFVGTPYHNKNYKW